MVEKHRVSDDGTLSGLSAHKGEEVLLLRIPRVDEARVDAWVRRMEDEAEAIARKLDMDPARARTLVHDTAEGAKGVAAKAAEVMNRLASPITVARESAAERQAISDVAVAAQKPEGHWEPEGAAGIGKA